MERCKKVKERRKPKDIGHYSISFKNSQNVDFCTCLSKNVIKCGASENKGTHHIAKAFFGHFHAENLQNVQKMHFWPEAPGVNELITRTVNFSMLIEN